MMFLKCAPKEDSNQPEHTRGLIRSCVHEEIFASLAIQTVPSEKSD